MTLTHLNFSKAIFLFLLSFSQAVISSSQNNLPLFPIEEKGKWGFINQQGKVVIKPIFKNVGEFNHGLAPVRLKGRYGYIDPKGKYVIEPIFDSGTNFVNGIAFVHIDGKKFLIDTTGAILFQHDYKDIACGDEPCTMQRFIVTTQYDQGIVNSKGEVIVDTIYNQIFPYKEGAAIIKQGHQTTALIDTLGNFILPFNRYAEIEPFYEAIAKVVISRNPYNYFGAINKSGDLITSFTDLRYKTDYRNSSFREGILPVKVLKTDSVLFTIYNKEGLYKGALTPEGKIIIGDTILNEKFLIKEYFPKNSNPFYNGDYALLDSVGIIQPLNKYYDYIGPFSQNRAFVRESLHYGPSQIIDRQGKIVNKEPFRNLYGEGFKDGIAIAEVKEGIVPVDTNGNYIYPPRAIDGNCIYRDSCIFFDAYVEDEKSTVERNLWGFWDLTTNVFVEARFDRILSLKGFQNDLLYVMEDSIKGYVNRKGKYVWREKRKANDYIHELDTDYMLVGGFSAASPYKAELAGFGGWASSDNISKKLERNKKLKSDQFYIEIRDKEKEVYADQYQGYAFYIINTSPDTVVFDAQDSWLYMTIQARDNKGNWKPIQYIPSSWCGNSYHQVFLATNEYWKFIMPKISGAQKTKFRISLRYKDPKTKEDKYVYSNEVMGSINPSQFWKKQGYSPSNLMDPYDE